MAAAAFVHPGCLSTQADLDRMAAKVAAGEQPWKGGWDRLAGNTDGYLDDAPLAQMTINVGGGLSENYIRLAMDCAKAYQCALRYNISGETAYGDKAVEIMNTWASVMTGWAGDTNVSLRAGIYGYEMACAAELMRDYPGWDAADFAAFKTWMIDVFYSKNTYFLTYKHGTCDSHYWANWDLSVMASMMAIGVLCDRQDIFDEGLNYFYNGSGNGNINNAVHTIHPDGTGQWQESGRDQGHASMGPQLLGTICEIAWHQGIDLYGYERQKFLSASEYIAKYNLWNDVPYVCYINCEYWVNPVVSSSGRGTVRPGWDLIYNHYVNRLGIAAPYTAQMAAFARPDGGGFNYGTTSGGFDGLGFTTLTHSLDPIVDEGTPGNLLPHVKGSQIMLSWRGTPYGESYNVKRSTTRGGPYILLAKVKNGDNYYVDTGLISGKTYYYVVSANNPGGESADSAEAFATTNRQLYGTHIGTVGSWDNKGATGDLAFDGSLRNFFDPPAGNAWTGLDLGAGVSAVITEIRYCPRDNFSGRMVGGKFQGSNTADFSSGVVDLYTVTTEPSDGVLTLQAISSPGSFRYLRYLAPPGEWCNVAEVQFLGNVSGASAPTTPTGLSGRVVNGYQIALTWNAVSGATSYNVKRSTTKGGPYIIIANTTVASFQDKDLSGDTTYFYVISALNSAGESTHSSEVKASTQTAGPILGAHYEMEDNVEDCRNGYHAVTTGEPNYVEGKIGLAVDLDGIDDYITLPAGVANCEDMTIAAWVHWDGGGDWQRIFDFGNNTSQYLFLTPKSGGSNTLRFAIKNSGDEQIVETSQLAAGQWVHVAVTLDGDRGILYINGLPVDTNDAVTINPADFMPVKNYIGDSQWDADPLFDGRIDDVRIYNYALSDAAVLRLARQKTNIADLTILASWWLWLTRNCGTGNDCMDADLNGDGKVDMVDFADLGEQWLKSE